SARWKRSAAAASAAPTGRRAIRLPPEGGRLEAIDGGNWRDFVAAPAAVLLIGKSTCPACQGYALELSDALGVAEVWPGVRFGKVELDRGGLIDFKRANPWLADLDT